MNILRSCSRGGEHVLHLGVLSGRARTSPGSTATHRRSWLWRLPRNSRHLRLSDGLAHEYSLAAELDPAWAAKPLALTRHVQCSRSFWRDVYRKSKKEEL